MMFCAVNNNEENGPFIRGLQDVFGKPTKIEVAFYFTNYIDGVYEVEIAGFPVGRLA